jgi:hypothetical protein
MMEKNGLMQRENILKQKREFGDFGMYTDEPQLTGPVIEEQMNPNLLDQ